MKKRFSLLLSCCFFFITMAQAQQLLLPETSPKATVSQVIGLTEISVKYHTPSVKGREIWGKLVPFGQVWRAGANEATLITFSHDVTVNGEPLAAGTYSFFTIPETRESWTLIFNKNLNLWGTFNYDPKEDVLRVPGYAQPDQFHETLFYSFTNIQSSVGQLNLNWEKMRLPIQIETQTHKHALANIKTAIENARDDNWKVYAQAVNYLVQNNLEPELALYWVNKSLAIDDNFYNNWLKAQLLAQHNEYKEAVNIVKKAIKLGEQNKEAFQPYQPDLELALRDWKIKQH